jgi:NADPH:quinone reductase-like Zn-dependent oxidoreductase
MQAYRIERFGSVDGLELRSSDDPRPGLREVLMRVRELAELPRPDGAQGRRPRSDQAWRDTAFRRRGRSRSDRRWRDTGQSRRSDCRLFPSAVVWRAGSAPISTACWRNTRLSEEALVHVPSHLSFEEAATLPCAAVTAWAALTGHGRVTAGDAVLTQGSGGVSVFALQFARLLGARVIATTSTAEKAERLRALGASEVINYTKTPDWDAKARELTDGRGVDCVVEIGGPGTIAMSLSALAVGGHVSLIGASLTPSGTGLDPLLLTGRGITLGRPEERLAAPPTCHVGACSPI